VRDATLPGTRDDRQAGSAGGSEGSAFWLWMAADNLRLVARAAASCAAELAALRPASPVC
jgi:aspartate-semialdehyde dehydrogenase